jgi:hypothetical protein
MKGYYITQDGQRVKVEDFDPMNKMVYVAIGSGQYKWYMEREYSLWTKEDSEETKVEIVETDDELAPAGTESSFPPMPETEEPKPKKRGRKKKSE